MWRVALFLQMPTKEGQVLHVGPEQNVESVPNDGDGTDCSVEEDISQHTGDQSLGVSSSESADGRGEADNKPEHG